MENKTRVFFKVFNGEILALFPEEIVDQSGNIQSYQHIGQHGAASPELKYCRNASPNEYRALKQELESIGYILKVVAK
jgi:hypothetical protein